MGPDTGVMGRIAFPHIERAEKKRETFEKSSGHDCGLAVKTLFCGKVFSFLPPPHGLNFYLAKKRGETYGGGRDERKKRREFYAPFSSLSNLPRASNFTGR